MPNQETDSQVFDRIVNDEYLAVPEFLADLLNNQDIKFYEDAEAYSQSTRIFIRIMVEALCQQAVKFEDTPLGRVANSTLTAYIASALDFTTSGAIRTPSNFPRADDPTLARRNDPKSV